MVGDSWPTGGSALQSHTAAWPRNGKRLSANVRVVDRGRWYEIHPGRLIEVGWGDLSFTDLVGLQATVAGVVAVILPKRQGAPTIAMLTDPEEPTVDGLVDEAIVAVTAELGAVAVNGSTPILASIDRPMLRDAALAVHRA